MHKYYTSTKKASCCMIQIPAVKLHFPNVCNCHQSLS